MTERLINPEDFMTGAPPRIMGTEAEDHVGLRVHKTDDPFDEDIKAIEKILSKNTLKKAGIRAFSEEGPESWLENGQLLYIDCDEMLESASAEQLGPKKALAGTMAGIQVLEKLADASGEQVQIFRRSSTVDVENLRVASAGFHMNHITSEETATQILVGDRSSGIEAHAATRLYAWEGMVAPEGFTLSQKAHVYSNIKNTSFYKVKQGAGEEFKRIEDYSGDHSSPWGTFMAMATTSVLLRVLEHPEQKDLNKRMKKLKLENPCREIQTVSSDTKLQEILPFADGRRKGKTAIQIQTEFADIAAEFGRRFKLPADEQYAVDQWQQVCRDLSEAAKSGDLRPLATRIGWVSKKLWLEGRNIGELHAENHEAVKLDMSWDSLYPKKGGRLIYPQKTGLTIVTNEEVAALVDSPPQDTRAAVRGCKIKDPSFTVDEVYWDEIKFRRYRTRKKNAISVPLHPYQTRIQEE